MGLFGSESAKQIYEIVAPLKDKFLNSQNYEEWKFHMTWSLISQDLWHVARGQHLSEITLDKDYLVSKSIKLTIDYPLSLKIWKATFCSSQELWDYLRSEFGQGNQHKQKQQTSEIEQGYFETQVTREVIELANEAVDQCLPLSIEQSDMFFIAKDNMNLLKGYDASHLSQDFQLDEGEYDRHYQIFGLDESESCHIVENASQDLIQQLEVPFIDDSLEVASLSSLVQSFMYISEYAASELIFECTCTPSKGSYESMYQKLDWSPLRNDHLLHGSFIIWDEVFEHQVYTADFKDELVLELSWMDIHEQTTILTSIITKVSQHALDLPLYMNLHTPFTCTHDGKVEDNPNLDDCLGYISYPDIGGLTKKLKVSYRCLHLRNPVLIVLDTYDHQSLVTVKDNALMVQSADSVPGQLVVDQFDNTSVDLYDADMIERWPLISDEIYEFYHGLKSDFLRKRYALQKIHLADMGYKFYDDVYEQELFLKSYINSLNVYITKAREWYRGRKMWFKTILWLPWLLLWLSLLYFMSTA